MADTIKAGYYYPDISKEFKIARINYGLFEKKDGEYVEKRDDPMTLGDFDPTVNSSLINNVAAGRLGSKHIRNRIEKFTTEWYWELDKKTTKPIE